MESSRVARLKISDCVEEFIRGCLGELPLKLKDFDEYVQ